MKSSFKKNKKYDKKITKTNSSLMKDEAVGYSYENNSKMRINFNNVSFLKSSVDISSCPDGNVPEIAVVGRSNVGKSSFINAIFGRNKLAKISQKPGKTAAINYFDVGGDFYIVDLPGYGFARVSKIQKEMWAKMINGYLNNRAQLKSIIFLVDIRHLPSDDDFVMHEWIKQRNINYLLVATKCDKIKKSETDSKVKDIRERFNLQSNFEVFPFSSTKKLGIDQVKSKIEGIILND